MAETIELEAKAEEASPNGHTWQTFDDDQAFLQHILSKKPAEELVEVPEWEVKVLCRALSAKDRVEVQIAAFDEQSKRIDYRKCFHLIAMAGCYNPTTGHKVFTESHKDVLLREQDGAAIERLAMVLLRLSHMLLGESAGARKN